MLSIILYYDINKSYWLIILISENKTLNISWLYGMQLLRIIEDEIFSSVDTSEHT